MNQYVLTPNSSHTEADHLASLFDAQGTPLASFFDLQGPSLFSVVCLSLMVCMHL